MGYISINTQDVCKFSSMFSSINVNQSLASGVFPEKWKVSDLVPIFESGSKNNIENYRGIALLPTLGKFAEESLVRS